MVFSQETGSGGAELIAAAALEKQQDASSNRSHTIHKLIPGPPEVSSSLKLDVSCAEYKT